MLETIRGFASELREHLSDLNDLERRHAIRALEVVRSANLSDGTEPLLQRHEVVLSERDDIRKALDWARDHDQTHGIEMCIALEAYWAATDPAEGASRLEDLLTRASPLRATLEARARRAYGGALYRQGEFERGTREHQRSRDLFRALGDDRGAAALEARLAIDAAYFGDSTSHAPPRSACSSLRARSNYHASRPRRSGRLRRSRGARNGYKTPTSSKARVSSAQRPAASSGGQRTHS